MKPSVNIAATMLYGFMAWRVGGLKGLAASAVIVLVIACARGSEKGMSRNAVFFLDMLYWSILAVPFFL